MKVAKFIARAMVAPAGISYERHLEVILLSLALSVLVFLIVLSLPPVVDAVIADEFLPSVHSFLLQERLWLNRWTPSLRLSFEILAAVTIGGSVFAASIANSLREKLGKYQSDLLETVRSQMSANERKTYGNIRKISYLTSTAKINNVFRRIPALVSLSWEIYSLFGKELPKSYKRFLRVALFSSFPGGGYGLLAFLFLTLLCAVKVIQIYLTKLP